MNAPVPGVQRAATHAVLRFAVAVTAAFVIGEVLGWWPSFLAAVLAAVLLASLPVRPTLRMAVGLVAVMAVVAWLPYLLASLLRGVPVVLFGLAALGMLLGFHALLQGRPKLPAMLLLICLAVIPVVVLTAPAQAAALPWALVRGMALALALILVTFAAWPAMPPPRATPAYAPLGATPWRLALLATGVMLPILLVYLLFGLVDALPVIVTTVMLVIHFDPGQSARHALALILGNLAGGLLGWCMHLALLTTPTLPFLALLLFLVSIGFAQRIAVGGAVGAVALVACNAALIIFGTALATGPASVMVWLTRLAQFALAGAFALGMMHLLWQRFATVAARPAALPSPSTHAP
ncbi:DUF2955 domain-containing protein [Stenotrophomonas rhizophila]|uniref:DUF2955 domain-containing protein n=1 Tax=Stenotrophomonas rhizophila TaxID=216778 RepID=UPI00164333B1|nr:DUF2955 domain-containing protein [Stenotrophomonas rhizophila]